MLVVENSLYAGLTPVRVHSLLDPLSAGKMARRFAGLPVPSSVAVYAHPTCPGYFSAHLVLPWGEFAVYSAFYARSARAALNGLLNYCYLPRVAV